MGNVDLYEQCTFSGRCKCFLVRKIPPSTTMQPISSVLCPYLNMNFELFMVGVSPFGHKYMQVTPSKLSTDRYNCSKRVLAYASTTPAPSPSLKILCCKKHQEAHISAAERPALRRAMCAAGCCCSKDIHTHGDLDIYIYMYTYTFAFLRCRSGVAQSPSRREAGLWDCICVSRSPRSSSYMAHCVRARKSAPWSAVVVLATLLLPFSKAWAKAFEFLLRCLPWVVNEGSGPAALLAFG